MYPESDEANAASLIIQDYNQGVGFANYTAHCSTNGWADPSFSVTDVANITNLNSWVGFKPKTEIDDGISQFVEWYESYYGV